MKSNYLRSGRSSAPRSFKNINVYLNNDGPLYVTNNNNNDSKTIFIGHNTVAFCINVLSTTVPFWIYSKKIYENYTDWYPIVNLSCTIDICLVMDQTDLPECNWVSLKSDSNVRDQYSKFTKYKIELPVELFKDLWWLKNNNKTKAWFSSSFSFSCIHPLHHVPQFQTCHSGIAF